MAKSKLHQLLAVQTNLRTQADTTRNDLMHTFDKKTARFQGITETYTPVDLNAGEVKTDVKLKIQTTVAKELAWLTPFLVKVIDNGHQVDVANTAAKADIELEDGTVLLRGVPSTSLLQLEHRIVELQAFIKTIPTLDPAKGFDIDKTQSSDGTVFAATPVNREKTEKKFEYIVMVGPTDKHPAAIKELNLDRVVGNTVIQEWSSLITVADKGDMLDRVEVLLRAVKKARSVANDIEVDPKANQVGQTLLDYVFAGKTA